MKEKNRRVWMLLMCMSFLFFQAPLNVNTAYAATNDVEQARKENEIDVGNVGQSGKQAETKRCDVSLRCASSDRKQIFGNEKFVIYRIADEKGMRQGDFSDVKASDDESEYAKNLADSINDAENAESYAEITTGADGSARISLPYGTYLITGDIVSESGYTYTPAPFLITLDANMETNLASYVKYKTTEPSPTPQNPETPKQNNKSQSGRETSKVKTNDTKALYVYGAIAIISAVVFVVAIAERRKQK